MRSFKIINLGLLQMRVDPWFAHAFTLFTDVCFSAKSKDRFGGMMMSDAILSTPRTSSPTFLWFIGFDDVSMRLQTWRRGSCERTIGWRPSTVGCQSCFGQSEFDFLDAEKDPEWPLLVFPWCIRVNNKANQCLKCSHTFPHALNMCQTQKMNATDMHAAASPSPLPL